MNDNGEVTSSVQIGFAKLFLFLFDGDIGFWNRTMSANFVSELVAVFSSCKSQGNPLMQALVGLFDPVLLVLAMLINQLGDRGTVSGLQRLDLLIEAIDDGLKIIDTLMMSIKTAPGVGTEESEAHAGIFELAL